jgi:hypothetical protein
MTAEQFAPVMFAGLIVIMLIGFPVAFSLAALGLLCGFIAIQAGWFPAAFMGNLPLNLFSVLSNDLLLAIPFFTLMGTIVEKCGLAEDLLDSMGQLFGPLRGGLGYSVIIVGFILGAITGTVAGQVIAMAMISEAIEQTGQPSSTTTIRLVFFRLASTVALSSGRRVRRSITSASMPSLSSCLAASSASPTCCGTRCSRATS